MGSGHGPGGLKGRLPAFSSLWHRRSPGIVLIARLISFLFERYGVQTYGAILGLVLASPFAIFYNTGLFGELSSLSVWAVLLGIMLMIGGAVVTNFVGEK